MQTLYSGCKTIILFLIIMLVVQTAFGDKTAQKSSVMILFSILILQSDTVSTYLKNITTELTSNKKTLSTLTDGTSTDSTTNGQTSTHTSSSGRTHSGASREF